MDLSSVKYKDIFKCNNIKIDHYIFYIFYHCRIQIIQVHNIKRGTHWRRMRKRYDSLDKDHRTDC